MSISSPTPVSPRNKRLPYLLAGICVLALGVFFALDHRKDSDSPLPTPHSGVADVPEADAVVPTISTKPTVHRLLYGKGTSASNTPSPPSALAEVLDPEGDMPFSQRLASVHALPAEVPGHVSEALAAYIADPREPGALTPSQQLALANDILNVLGRQEGFRNELRRMLLDLVADSSRDITLRDYALQHLAVLNLDRNPSSPADRSPDAENPDMWSSHWAAIEGGDHSLSATAMLHLLSAARQGNLGEPDKARLAAAALRLARDGSTHPHSRATAFQVCGRLRFSEARQPAYAVASSDEEPFPLRIAAIATLGDLQPTPDVLDMLHALQSGPEIRLRVPATSSLHRLNSQ